MGRTHACSATFRIGGIRLAVRRPGGNNVSVERNRWAAVEGRLAYAGRIALVQRRETERRCNVFDGAGALGGKAPEEWGAQQLDVCGPRKLIVS